MSFGGQYGGIASGGVGQGISQGVQQGVQNFQSGMDRLDRKKQQELDNKARQDQIDAQRDQTKVANAQYLWSQDFPQWLDLQKPLAVPEGATPEELASIMARQKERDAQATKLQARLASYYPVMRQGAGLATTNADGTPMSFEAEFMPSTQGEGAVQAAGAKSTAQADLANNLLPALQKADAAVKQAFATAGADSQSYRDAVAERDRLTKLVQASWKTGYGSDWQGARWADDAQLGREALSYNRDQGVKNYAVMMAGTGDAVGNSIVAALQAGKRVSATTNLADLGINQPGTVGDWLKQSATVQAANDAASKGDWTTFTNIALNLPQDQQALLSVAGQNFLKDLADPNTTNTSVQLVLKDLNYTKAQVRSLTYQTDKSQATDPFALAASGNAGYRSLLGAWQERELAKGRSPEAVAADMDKMEASYQQYQDSLVTDLMSRKNQLLRGKMDVTKGLADAIKDGSLFLSTQTGADGKPVHMGGYWDAVLQSTGGDEVLAGRIFDSNWNKASDRWTTMTKQEQDQARLVSAQADNAEAAATVAKATVQDSIKQIQNGTLKSDAEIEVLGLKTRTEQYAYLNQIAQTVGERGLSDPAVVAYAKKHGLDPSAAAATAKFTEWQRKNAIEQADYDKLAKLLANPSITLASSQELTALTKKMGIDGNFLLSEAKRLRTQGIKMDAATLEQMQVSIWATRNGVQINWANYWAGRQDSARDYARGVFVSDRAYNWGVTTFNQTFARDNFVKDRDYALNQANSIISAVNAGRQVDAAVLQSLTVASTDLNTSIGQTASMIDQDSKDIAALEASTPLLKSADGNRPYTVDPKTGVYSVKPNINDPQVAQYVRLQNDKLARTQTVNELLATKDTLRTQISGAISQATASSSNTDFTPLFQSLGIDRSLLPGNQGTPPPSSGGTVTVPKNLTDAYSVLSGGAKVKVTQQAGATTTDPKGHAGSDLVILGANGSPVKGASIKNPFAGATVLEVGAWDGKNDPKAKNFGSNTYGYGNYVKLALPGGYTAIVAHMDAPSTLKSGQALSQGDLLGLQGKTGNATGYHVHLEVRDPSGKAIRDAATLQSLFGPGSALFPKAGAAPTTPTSAPSGTEFSFSYKPIAGARRNLTQVGPADAFYVQTPQGYDVYTPQQGRALVSQINMAMKKNLAGYLGRSVGERKEALKMYLGALGVGGFAVDTIVDDFFKPAK